MVYSSLKLNRLGREFPSQSHRLAVLGKLESLLPSSLEKAG